jgi:hypothetical protein
VAWQPPIGDLKGIISNIWFGNIGGLAGQNELCQELGGRRCMSGASLCQFCEVVGMGFKPVGA